jgi:hypothetical protein
VPIFDAARQSVQRANVHVVGGAAGWRTVRP